MKRIIGTSVAVVGLVFGTLHAYSQSVVFDFQDSTDQGFGLKFNNDASASFSIVNIGGSLRMAVPRTGAFQEVDIGSGGNPFLAAMNAAALNPSGYTLSYDWYVDTSLSPGNYGTFLQIGSYINAGSGAYQQDFGAAKEVELNGIQLASGQVFSGTFSQTFTQTYGAIGSGFTTPTQTFMRLGFILNGDGSAATVYFDNVSVSPVIAAPVPEPSTLALAGLGAMSCMLMLRRRLA